MVSMRVLMLIDAMQCPCHADAVFYIQCELGLG